MKNSSKGFLICFCIFFLGFALSAIAQQNSKLVKGVVCDTDGIPMIGASVTLKNAQGIGVITDINGNFEITVPDGSTLQISFLGFNTEEIKVNSSTSSILKITLKQEAIAIDDVVVIGYGSQKKVAVTGSLSTVSSEDLIKSPVTNLANALAGNLTGFSSIQSSGQPGADDPTIFIRGIGSLDVERSQPLIMVDGVERSFYKLDPNEVESVTVLKDASATAVFGVRGANGVILVTTKRGTPGKMQISVSSSVGVQKPIRLYDFANSYDYATLYNERYLNDNPDTAPESLPFKPNVLEAFKNHSQPLIYPDTDWQELILKPVAFQTMHNVSISGGTKNVRYFTSLGFVSQDGLYRSFDSGYNSNIRYNRYNYRTNLDIDITKSTLLSINLGGRTEDSHAPVTKDNNFDPQMATYLPFAGVGLYEGKWIRASSDYIPFTDGALENADAFEKFYGRGYYQEIRNEINLDVNLKQKLDMILKGLSVGIKGSYNSYYTHRKTWSKSMPFYTAHLDENNEIYLRKRRDETAMQYSEGTGRGRDWYLEANINYNGTFGNHHVSGLVLYNQWKQPYPDPNKFQYSNIPRGYVGLVGRATYDYDYRYLMDINVGYNGSENFAPGKRYGLFPALSLGWILSEEKFMKKTKSVLDYLKIRGSIGLVGNDLVTSGERFFYMPDEYDPNSGGYNFGSGITTSLPGAVEKKVGNPDVTWEKALKYTVGIDFKLFNNRLGGTIDLFKENRRDILSTINTNPSFIAVQLPIVNLGKVKNQGFEVELTWQDHIREFNYWIKANCSVAQNEVVYKDEIPKEYEWQYETGRPVGQHFGYVFDGFVTEEDIVSGNLPDQRIDLKPGDVKYKDLNKDGQITELDKAAIGYPEYPQLVGGLTIGFKYKGFDFSMLWSGSARVSRFVNESLRIPFGTLGFNPLQQYIFDGRWTPETAETAKLPRVSSLASTNNFGYESTLWLKNTAYARLKNLQIGYQINFKGMKKIGLDNFRVYVAAENLFTIDSYKISDPENTVQSYPLQTIVNLGVNLNF